MRKLLRNKPSRADVVNAVSSPSIRQLQLKIASGPPVMEPLLEIVMTTTPLGKSLSGAEARIS